MSEPAATRASARQPADRSYRGRTLDARRAEQRERVLRAACEVFAARGYAGAGIDEIVARAHVSRTTFYLFFENKEDCLLAVFEHGLGRIGGQVLQTVARTADQALAPAERVRAEVAAVAGALAADPALARVMLIEVVGATPAAEEARMRARHQAAQIIEAQLERYERWSERSALERRIASQAAMAAIGEVIADLVVTGRADEWEAVAGPISEFVARGLQAH